MPAIYLGQTFNTVEDFLTAKSLYEKEQHVPYVIGNSKSAKAYNSQQVDGSKLMPVEMRWKEATVMCKHNGKARFHKHEEGKKERPNQSTFKVDCHAKFNLCFNVDRKHLVVTKLEDKHSNHPQDPSKLQRYPEYRRPAAETQAEVFALLDKEVKTHVLKGLVMSKGNLVTSQDLQNMRNRYIALRDGSGKVSPVEALLDEIQNLKEEDPRSIAVITHDSETFMIQNCFFQTSDMRISLEKYPEVLVMDTTYKLCDNEMPLVVFSVVDAFGAGRIAGYCLIISEKKEVVTASLEALLEGFPNLAEKVVTVVIDKDQSEVAAIKKIFPNADVHLCDFHVKRNFEKNSVKKLTDKWDKVEPLINKLIHAFSEEEYDKYYSELQSLLGKESKLMRYYDKNWHKSDLKWSEYQRNMVFSMGERTTGRVESHNAKIKKIISKKHSPALVIQKLRLLNSFSNNEAEQKTFNHVSKIHYKRYSSDPVIQEIRGANTPFVADLIERQYLRSLEPPSSNEHVTSCDKCDCMMVVKYHLVCAHIFRERRKQGLEIYDHSQIPARWTVVVSPSKDSEKENLSVVSVITSPLKFPKRPQAMTMESRYTMALAVCKRFCSKIANYQGAQFENNLKALVTIEDLCNLGKDFTVIGLDGNQKPDIPILIVDENVQITTESIGDAENIHIDVQDPTPDSNIQDQSTLNIDPNVRSRLQLPVKPPVKGRPPKTTKGLVKKLGRKVRGDQAASHDVDVDDPSDVTKCEECNGPVMRRTSFTKKNYGRKYVVCSKPRSAECKSFHIWLDKVTSASSPTPEVVLQEWQNDCIVCIGTGPPSPKGGHKCCGCGVPVHSVDGVPCCSVAVTVEEGYGTNGRECLKCHFTMESTNTVLDKSHVNTSDKVTSTSSPTPEVVLEEWQNDCIVCIGTGPPSPKGGHKCCGCGVPVHSVDGVPCCSVAVTVEEGYGTNGRECLKCHFTMESTNTVLDKSHVNTSEFMSNNSEEIESEFAIGSPNKSDIGKQNTGSQEIESESSIGSPNKSDIGKQNTGSQEIDSDSSAGVTADHSKKNCEEIVSHSVDLAGGISIEPPTPICFACGMQAVRRTSTKEKSLGRQFYTCPSFPNHTTPKCKWISWIKQNKTLKRKPSMNKKSPSKQKTPLKTKGSHSFISKQRSLKEYFKGANLNSSSSLYDDDMDENLIIACETASAASGLNEQTTHFVQDENLVYSSSKCNLQPENRGKVLSAKDSKEIETITLDSDEDDVDYRNLTKTAVKSEHNNYEAEISEGTEMDNNVGENNAVSVSHEPSQLDEPTLSPMPHGAYVTLRRKRGNDDKDISAGIDDEDNALNDILKELNSTESVPRSRPARSTRLPKRIRTSYEFDSPY